MAMWADRTNILVVGHEVMERLVTIAGWCGGLRNWLKCLGRVSNVRSGLGPGYRGEQDFGKLY
jgi:hypothetical protein